MKWTNIILHGDEMKSSGVHSNNNRNMCFTSELDFCWESAQFGCYGTRKECSSVEWPLPTFLQVALVQTYL